MATQRPIEPLGFFTLEALQSGWYLAARVLPFTLPYPLLGLVVAFFLIRAGFAYPGGIAFCIALSAAFGVFINRTGRVVSGWAESRWGHPLRDENFVWLSIFWRAAFALCLVSLPLAPLNIAASVVGSGAGAFLFFIASIVALAVVLLAAGWAMSKVVADQLAGLAPATALEPAATAPAASTSPTATAVKPTPSPGRTAAESTQPRASSAPSEKLRCPKCGLVEAGRGPVIGWQCGACGWRGPRP